MRKPNGTAIERFLINQQSRDYTYAAVGATATSPPTGYNVDRVRVKLGVGGQTFATAKQAIHEWRQFQLGWIEAAPTTTPIAAGATVTVLVRAMGAWWLNASRIVYVVDETEATATRFGFAYGTLPGHAETGEEQFLIEHDFATDDVWYSILAFSRPRHSLARLGYPLVRHMQKRFGRESAAAMMRACAAASSDVRCIAGQDGRAI